MTTVVFLAFGFLVLITGDPAIFLISLYLFICYLATVYIYKPEYRIEFVFALIASIFLTPLIGLPIMWFFFRWMWR